MTADSPQPTVHSPQEEGRPSAVEPQKTLERRIPPFFAAFFYGFPILAAWVLLYNAFPGASKTLWTPVDPLREFAIGLGLGATLLAVRWIGLKTSKPARALESEFGWIAGRQRKWECLLLAVLSGVAEEYFFRGWLQTWIGVWVAAGVFALLHWPVNRNFMLWPFFAFAAGLAFGWVTLWTGTLIAAATAHAVYNAVALWRISDRFADWNQKKVDAFVETGRLE